MPCLSLMIQKSLGDVSGMFPALGFKIFSQLAALLAFAVKIISLYDRFKVRGLTVQICKSSKYLKSQTVRSNHLEFGERHI